jgi:hypothetical protein
MSRSAPAFTLCGAAALLLFSCVSYSSLRARFIPDHYPGMNIHEWADPDLRVHDAMGVAWLRMTFNWSEVEREEGVWDFSRLDQFVDGAAGKKILAILAYESPWIYGKGKVKRKIDASHLSLFLRYVETVVKRYRGKVDAWEIWNEPNFIFWEGTDGEFFELSGKTARTIREIDRDAIIVGGSFNRVPASFIRRMFRYGALEEVDVLSFHPYDLDPAGVMRLYDRFRRILSEAGFRGKIWVTEIGYPTGGWYPTAVDESRFPSYIVKTFAGLAVRGAEICFWYELFDEYNRGEAPSPFNSESFFGLRYPDYSPKNGEAAYTLCAKHIAGKEYRPDIPLRRGIPSSVESLAFRGSGGRHCLIIWNRGTGEPEASLYLPGREQRVYDISTGTGADKGENIAVSVSPTPVIITWTSPPEDTARASLTMGRASGP